MAVATQVRRIGPVSGVINLETRTEARTAWVCEVDSDSMVGDIEIRGIRHSGNGDLESVLIQTSTIVDQSLSSDPIPVLKINVRESSLDGRGEDVVQALYWDSNALRRKQGIPVLSTLEMEANNRDKPFVARFTRFGHPLLENSEPLVLPVGCPDEIPLCDIVTLAGKTDATFSPQEALSSLGINMSQIMAPWCSQVEC